MRVLYLFFVLCVLGVCAQRRLAKPDASENSDTSSQRPVSRGRGRTRFSITPEFEQAHTEYEQVTKNIRKTDVPRRKLENAKPAEKRLPRPTKEPSPKGIPYEVKEVVDDVPRDDSRRGHKKPRVITESRFEAASAPKKELFSPASQTEEEASNLSLLATPSIPESIAEETALPAQLTTAPVNGISSTEKITEEISRSSESSDISNSSEIPKLDTELKRKQPEPTASSVKPPESRRVPHSRASSRTRGTTAHRTEEPTTPGSRGRKRIQPALRPEEPTSAVSSAPSTRSYFRAGRRRAEAVAESVQAPVKTQGPSVFAAESSQELSPRSRTGRKVSSETEITNAQQSRPEEKRKTGRTRGERTNVPKQTSTSVPANVDLNLKRRGDPRRAGRFTEPATEGSSTTRSSQHVPTSTTSNLPENVDPKLNRRVDARREGGRFTEQPIERSANTPSSKYISTSNAPEKVDLNVNRRTDARRGRLTEPSTSRNTNKAKNVNESETRSQRRSVTRTTTQKNIDSTTQQTERQSRGRGRSRSILTLNEQKLEVLPLFENEPKIVIPTYDSATIPSRSSLGRRRSLNSAEDIATASTKQSEVQFEVDPINEESETATDSNIRISREESVSAEKAIRKVYKKRPTFQRTKPPRKLHRALAESKEETTEAVFIRKFRPLNSRKNAAVDSSKEEVTVNDEDAKTSKVVKTKSSDDAKPKNSEEEKENAAKETKEKVDDNENTKQTVKVDEPKVSIREVVRKVSQKLPSTKGKEKVSVELSTSQEAIAEGDNYPIPYKAAIQAKKSKKEGLGSRSAQSNELSVTKTTEASVISSSASTTLDSSSETPAAENVVNEDEEIDHKSESESTTVPPSTKFPRPRFSLTTKLPRSTENSSESTNKNGPNRPGLPSRKYKPGKPKPSVTTTTQGSTDEDSEASLTTTPSPLQKFHARFKSSRSQKDKSSDVHITPRTAHKSRSYSPKAPKGLYSSRKFAKTTIPPDASEETEKPQPPKFSVETSALPTKVPPVGHSIKKSSRFSARYRSDILSRSGVHRTSTAGPSYIPTIPTVTPPPTSVKFEENELGMEIISFDDPVANTVPSDNLVSGDYLSSSPSTKTDPTVESKGAAAHTTEKPVSIIERIINSITSISTTTSPDGTTKTSTTTSGQPTKSSAILNLVSKKPKDKTVTVDLPLESASQKLTNSPNSVEYRTTEKPTTIIEKILSSLSAIRADTPPETTTADPLQVGSNYNTVDTTLKLSSTESTSRVATATVPMSKGSSATALPLISKSTTVLPTSTASSSSTGGSTILDSSTSSTVPSLNDISSTLLHTSSVTPRSIPSTTPLSSQAESTTLDPKNTFEEILSDQILPKRTIDKLLSLLNIVTPTSTTPRPTTTKLVVVTPKLTTFITSNTEPISTEQNATPVPTTLPIASDSISVSSSSETTNPTVFTSTLKSSETTSNDINSIVNPLTASEPALGSRILDMISTISRMMGSTLSPTTISTTSASKSDSVSTVNLLSATPRTIEYSTGTSTTTGSSESGTSAAPVISTASTGSTVTTTTGGFSTFTPAGTSTTVSPTTSAGSVSTTTPIEPVSTSVGSANPLAVTDSATVSVTIQTNLPISSILTTQTSAPTSSTFDSIVTNPSTIASATPPASLTTQGTTSTKVSVVPGSDATIPSATPNSITSTVASNTQTASTLLTTVNTTPTSTPTASSTVTIGTTRPQTEAISASTGTTGSSIITSTTKFTRETTTDSTLDAPTTLPTLANFEVSPDRVSIYSANDISSTFVADDPVSTTVSISARAFVPGTISSTVAEATTSNPVTTTQNLMPTSQPTVGTTGVSSTVTVSTRPSNVGSTSTASPTTNSISSSVATAVPLANQVTSSSTVITSTSSPLITSTNSVKFVSSAVDVTTQDVSSNTIDTSSVTDKQSLVNQTDVSNLVNPLSAGTNVSVADNSSMSSGLFVSPSLPDKSTSTTNTRIAMMEFMTRDGKLLRFEPNPLQNSMQTKIRNKDYFIFAVLPNNTILRKRPSMYPTKETPFLIYGVLPNNTLIQKFPNGTIVPMEPVIQVIGFDTRENPPPAPEIISNQVTSDQESRPDNNKVSTSGVSSLEANLLSINRGSGTTASTLPPLTEILGGRTVKAFNSIIDQTRGEAKIQTLEVDPLTNKVQLGKVVYSGNVIFRWKPVTRPNLTPVVQQIQSRLNLENVEINTISSASSSPPPPPPSQPSSTAKAVTTSAPPSPTTQPPGPPSTEAPFTTPLPLTTSVPIITTLAAITSPKITTGRPITTILPSTNPPGPPATNPTYQPRLTSTTTSVSPTTLFPMLTTLLSTLQPRRVVTTTVFPAITSTTVPPGPTTVSTTQPDITTILSPVSTTLTAPFTSPLPTAYIANPLSAIPDIDDGDSPKVPSPSLMDLLSNGAKISSTPSPTAALSSTVSSLKDINLKQKQLTAQQKKDLETLEALEKEQAAILQQLAFLTGLNLGGASPPKKNDNLADRVIATALKRAKGADSSSTNSPSTFNLLETLSPKDSRQSKTIARAPSVEELVKQINANGLNSVTPAGPIVTSTYGKTNDALLASLLKEYGVGPSTPKVLSGAYAKEIRSTTSAPKITTTKRAVTTEAPGRIMQGLNWLLNALAPPPSAKPAQAKSKPKPKPTNKNDELLSKQPTEITPVVVEPPDQPGEESKTENNVISQTQLLTLVKQLEEIQKDPTKAKDLDIEALKALQNIESSQKGGIQVTAGSATGATARTFVTTNGPKLTPTKPAGGAARFTSPLPLSVSNSIVDDIEGTSGSKTTIPPVNLKEVPGVAADLETAITKTKIPPVKLNPVPGIPDENPKIRGQLVNYAINVTKAISSFLGTAIQGAANSFQSMIGSGSRTTGNYRKSDSSN